ncbi:hypothetical protein C3L33_09599, partial [Rhododendron williamsianum]
MEEPTVISLDESFEECPQNAQFVLVGKILSSKVLNKVGVLKKEDDLCRVISRGPWSVMGALLVLRKWDQKKSFSDLDFNFSPFWIQIHGLPLGFLNSKAGMVITKSIGDPLKKGFFLRRVKEEDSWVRFKYERLSDFCYGCGMVGHAVNEVKTPPEDEDDGGTSKEVLEELVDSNKGILNENEAAAVGPCGGGTCASVRTVRTKLQEQISNVETNGQSSKTNIPDTRKNSMCDPQKVLTHNPFLSSGSNVLGGEKVISSGAHYYVEEPDSPTGSHTILQMGCGSEDGLNKGRGAPLFSGPEREGGSHKMGEEGLVSAFSKVLNLKRKTTCSPERDSKEKRQKRLRSRTQTRFKRKMMKQEKGFFGTNKVWLELGLLEAGEDEEREQEEQWKI